MSYVLFLPFLLAGYPTTKFFVWCLVTIGIPFSSSMQARPPAEHEGRFPVRVKKGVKKRDDDFVSSSRQQTSSICKQTQARNENEDRKKLGMKTKKKFPSGNSDSVSWKDCSRHSNHPDPTRTKNTAANGNADSAPRREILPPVPVAQESPLPKVLEEEEEETAWVFMLMPKAADQPVSCPSGPPYPSSTTTNLRATSDTSPSVLYFQQTRAIPIPQESESSMVVPQERVQGCIEENDRPMVRSSRVSSDVNQSPVTQNPVTAPSPVNQSPTIPPHYPRHHDDEVSGKEVYDHYSYSGFTSTMPKAPDVHEQRAPHVHEHMMTMNHHESDRPSTSRSHGRIERPPRGREQHGQNHPRLGDGQEAVKEALEPDVILALKAALSFKNSPSDQTSNNSPIDGHHVIEDDIDDIVHLAYNTVTVKLSGLPSAMTRTLLELFLDWLGIRYTFLNVPIDLNLNVRKRSSRAQYHDRDLQLWEQAKRDLMSFNPPLSINDHSINPSPGGRDDGGGGDLGGGDLGAYPGSYLGQGFAFVGLANVNSISELQEKLNDVDQKFDAPWAVFIQYVESQIAQHAIKAAQYIEMQSSAYIEMHSDTGVDNRQGDEQITASFGTSNDQKSSHSQLSIQLEALQSQTIHKCKSINRTSTHRSSAPSSSSSPSHTISINTINPNRTVGSIPMEGFGTGIKTGIKVDGIAYRTPNLIAAIYHARDSPLMRADIPDEAKPALFGLGDAKRILPFPMGDNGRHGKGRFRRVRLRSPKTRRHLLLKAKDVIFI